MKVVNWLLYIAWGAFTVFALDLTHRDWRWWVLLLIVFGIDFTSYFSKKQ